MTHGLTEAESKELADFLADMTEEKVAELKARRPHRFIGATAQSPCEKCHQLEDAKVHD